MATRIIAAWYYSSQDDSSVPLVGLGLPPDLHSPHAMIDTRNPDDADTLLQGAIEGHVLVKSIEKAPPSPNKTQNTRTKQSIQRLQRLDPRLLVAQLQLRYLRFRTQEREIPSPLLPNRQRNVNGRWRLRRNNILLYRQPLTSPRNTGPPGRNAIILGRRYTKRKQHRSRRSRRMSSLH